MQLRTLTLLLLLWGAPTLSGCVAQEDQRRSQLEHEDVPSSLERARFLEDRAIDSEAAANRRDDPAKRRELYDRAIADLAEAQRLHEEELKTQPGSPEKQRFLQDEIDRLAERVTELHRIR